MKSHKCHYKKTGVVIYTDPLRYEYKCKCGNKLTCEDLDDTIKKVMMIDKEFIKKFGNR